MTTITNPQGVHTFYSKKLLSVLEQRLQMYALGVKAVLPRNSGNMIQWLRYQRLAPATTPLVEGIPPTENQLIQNSVIAAIQEYGDFVKISDLLEATAIDPVVESALEHLGRQGALTLDTIIINELVTTLPAQYANNKTSLATVGSSDVFTAKEILKGVITLKKNLVGPMVDDDYIVVAHSASLGDLMNDTNVGSWVDLNKYFDAAAKRPLKGELGKTYGARILESQNIPFTNVGTLGGATVYSNILLGEDAFGVVQLDGKSVQTFVKPVGSAGSLDPLNQVGTVGWKVLGFAAKYMGGVANGTSDLGVIIYSGSQF
jgi:N4-gp56 family major capsid protein